MDVVRVLSKIINLLFKTSSATLQTDTVEYYCNIINFNQ